MRVLVSGSSGLVGSALVARLQADGHVVHRLVRRESHDGEATIDIDAGTIDASRMPGRSLEGLDAVVNLAGEPLMPSHLTEPPRWTRAKKERIRASRIRTTDLIARVLAGLHDKPAVLVSGSAIGYYGDRGDEILVEGMRPGAGFLAEVCVDWEAATRPAAEAGIRVVQARTGIVLDGSGGFLKAVLPVFRHGLGGRIGGGWQWMSWISLEDEVRAILHAISTPTLAGVVNLVSPVPARNREMTEALAHAVGRPAVLSVPVAPLRLALGPDASGFALASQRVVPRRLERSGFVHAHPELADAVAVAITQAGSGGSPHAA